MKRLVLLILSILAGVCLPSCASYMANQCNAPLLGKAHEGVINASVSFIPSAEFQAAYAPINHLGIIASCLFPGDGGNDSSSYGPERLLEIGAGYFNTIGSNGWRYGLYAGFGKGVGTNWYREGGRDFFSLSNHFDEVDHSIVFDYTQYFVQGEIGFVKGWFDGGFATRLLNVRMNTYREYITPRSITLSPDSVFEEATTMNSTPGQGAFLQYALFVRTRTYGNWGGEIEIWRLQPLFHESFSYYPLNLSFGVSWRFNFPQ